MNRYYSNAYGRFMTPDHTTPSYTGSSPNNVTGASYNYSYDAMFRLAGMTSGSTTVVSNVSYNAANQLLTMNFPGANETRSYNSLGQLISLSSGSGVNRTYNYPTGNDNGKISSMYDAVSGETVTYAYDSLNRMISASDCKQQNGTCVVQWAEGYTFDPFGNLTAKALTGGTSGQNMTVVVNETNNQIGSNDANGNALYTNASVPLIYDVENHTSGAGWSNGAPVINYGYDAQGKRVLLYSGTKDSNGNPSGYSVVAYSPSGQKLGMYQIYTCSDSGSNLTSLTICDSLTTSDQYFGGRRLASMDQLGSAGTYYPWGEAKGTTNPQDAWSYATYWRDSVSGLDYANNRYYLNAYGRFMTPDPSSSSAGPSNPQSWNRYAYTSGDPVNFHDPGGLMESPVCDFDGNEDPSCFGGGDGNSGFCDASQEDCGDPCVSAEGTPSPGPGCQTGGVFAPPVSGGNGDSFISPQDRDSTDAVNDLAKKTVTSYSGLRRRQPRKVGSEIT